MADIPAGYVALDLVGFTDRGPYVAGATYMINDLVHVNNAIWRCKVDNTSGIAPAENANWAIYIQSSTDLAGIMAVDTGGVLGAAGQVVVSQELISAITNMVMKELVKKTHIVNNLLATDTSTVLAGPMGKQLAEKDAELQKQINDTNSNFEKVNLNYVTPLTQYNTRVYRMTNLIWIEGSFVKQSGNLSENELILSFSTPISVYNAIASIPCVLRNNASGETAIGALTLSNNVDLRLTTCPSDYNELRLLNALPFQ